MMTWISLAKSLAQERCRLPPMIVWPVQGQSITAARLWESKATLAFWGTACIIIHPLGSPLRLCISLAPALLALSQRLFLLGLIVRSLPQHQLDRLLPFSCQY